MNTFARTGVQIIMYTRMRRLARSACLRKNVTGSEKTTLITQKRKIILLDRTVDEPMLDRLQFVSGA